MGTTALVQQLDTANAQLQADQAAGNDTTADLATIQSLTQQLAAANTPAAAGAPGVSDYLADLVPTSSDVTGFVSGLTADVGTGVHNLLGGLSSTVMLIGVLLIGFVAVAGYSGAFSFKKVA